MTKKLLVEAGPGTMSGEPCLAGARVPVRTLLAGREGGGTPGDFLEPYATVSRKEAIAFLEQAKRTPSRRDLNALPLERMSDQQRGAGASGSCRDHRSASRLGWHQQRQTEGRTKKRPARLWRGKRITR
jgi:uncharacterized protein (DUF433 family)